MAEVGQEPKVVTRLISSWQSLVSVSKGLWREVNVNNFKQILRLVKQDPSGVEALRSAVRALRAIRNVAGTEWQPKAYLEEIVADETWPQRLLITCHLHYLDYVPRFTALILSLPPHFTFAVTTDVPEIAASLLSRNIPNLSVYRSENRGRNFGPLLVELAEQIKTFEYVVHLHSKKSTHSTSDFASKWATAHWNLLGEDQELFRRLLSSLNSDKDIAIAYPLVTDIIPPRQFNWFSNEQMARDWFLESGLGFVDDPFPFPAGGMFIFRPSLFGALFEKKWEYADFPQESGQLDGTTQHMIERLMGAVPVSLGLKHLIYIEREDKFTTDASYPIKHM